MLKVNSSTLYTQQKWTDVFQTIEGLPNSFFEETCISYPLHGIWW